ncbi:hypothetical protein K3495_g6760 [Podosphaera aphanis]|nr:hypothetical protein K3495_g6760 [Podosphaera aphanis]
MANPTPSEANASESFFVSRNKARSSLSMSFSNVTQLTGRDTYDTWAAIMDAIWYSQQLGEMVIGGKKPEKDDSPEERERHICYCLSMQSLSSFRSNTAYSLVFQLGTFSMLPQRYDPSLPLSNFIENFESEYFRLLKLSSGSTEEHRQLFAKFFEHDKTKREYLLGFLSPFLKNVVDNLTTKGDLSFDEVKPRLLDTDYQTPTQTALITREQRGGLNFNNPAGIKKLKVCTYCQRHFPSANLNHGWHKCPNRRLKNSAEKGSVTKEMANVTITSTDQVSTSPFYFDTCATSHMCPYPDRFEYLDQCTGFVTSSSGASMAIRGKGSVLINCKLSDGSVSSFRLNDVLYVPELNLPLLSWRKISPKGYNLHASGKVMYVEKNNKIWLEAHFNGPLPVILESRYSNEFACMTYDFWHKALCHSAPSSIAVTEKLIQNQDLIPKPPKEFYCEACSLSKSLHHVPTSSSSRASEKG